MSAGPTNDLLDGKISGLSGFLFALIRCFSGPHVCRPRGVSLRSVGGFRVGGPFLFPVQVIGGT